MGRVEVRYCSRTKFGNTRRIAVAEDYFYAHMLNIDGKIEAAKQFGAENSVEFCQVSHR